MIVDGRKLQQEVLHELQRERSKFGDLTLAAIMVGENAQSDIFLRQKQKIAAELNVEFRLYRFEKEISREKLRDEINRIVRASVNTGVILQLPIPDKFNARYFLNAISPEKDIDALSARSLGDFYGGKEDLLPVSVAAVRHIFEKFSIDPRGKRAVVFGFGKLVGQPVSFDLTRLGATVTVIDAYERSPEAFSRDADIVVSGVGKKNLLTYDMIKNGAIVIDFGGDADQNIAGKTSLFTPTPGGIGPLVVAMIFKNLFTLASRALR